MKENDIRLRHWRKFLPKNVFDYPPFIFVVVIIPITYYFELWIVLPGIFEPYSFPYLMLLILGNFLTYNIVANLVGIIVVDTSISGRVMPSADTPGTHLCAVCETITPPRSYHCPDCNTCILKRDHHCKFSGCCVGHYNYRYFLMFLVHLLLAITISLPFNMYYLWDSILTVDIYTIPKILFPFAMLVIGPAFNISQFHIAIALISIVAMVAIGAWFYFHTNLVLRGQVVHEMRRCINVYDLGRILNIQEALGKRWYLVWLSPFIASPLPSDGVTFNTNSSADKTD